MNKTFSHSTKTDLCDTSTPACPAGDMGSSFWTSDIAEKYTYCLSLARAMKLDSRYWFARARSILPRLPSCNDRPPLFVIGCGRSGTTFLGDVLGSHPKSAYMFEPYQPPLGCGG